MKIGLLDQYHVLRKTDIGYMLLNEDEEEVFLHNNELNKIDIKEGQVIEAFVFYDKKNRTAATLFEPLVTLDRFSFVEVVEVVDSLGIFVHIGISKDILLSKDDLPSDTSLWPKVGDKLFGSLRLKKEAMVFKVANKPEILEHQNDVTYELHQEVEATVYYLSPEGISLITKDKQIIFVYQTNMRKKYRIGETVSVKIIHVKEKEYNGTLILQKELQIDEDAQIILEYLKRHQNEMTITQKSSPETIQKIFKMSKSAFKNALGRLYKQKRIELKEDKTILIQNEGE